jgi:NTP pyrophosphatase (non-canonical NTP hydrolase)
MNGETHSETHDEMWDRIRRLRLWLDENAGGQTESERNLLRVLKIGEEFGEVSEALHGALGANPRKGMSHSWADVRKELIDVAVTTLVALDTLGPEAEKEFDARLRHLVDRVTGPSGETA